MNLAARILGRLVPWAAAITLVLHDAFLWADDWPQWRGKRRDGWSQETGLLQEWPAGGPRLLWQRKEIGSGYSTPAVVGERLYLLANEGLENEFVQALAVADGKRVWSTRLGKVGNPDQRPNLPGARSTPTVDGDLLYGLSSDGDLACLEIGSGKVRWRKSLRTDFGGKPGTWAYSESPLIDGPWLVCTPGGGEATLVALDKQTGEVIWRAAVPVGDEAGYASVIAVQVGALYQYVQFLGKGVVGVEAGTGKFLWRHDKTVSRFNANIPTPVAHEGYVFSGGAGTGAGLIKLNLRQGTVEVEPVYFSPKLPTAVGGAVKVGDFLYGAAGQTLLCVEFATGNVRWEERSVAPGSLCVAAGRLYIHGEGGEVALVEPSPEGYREKGRFRPPDQPPHANPMEKAWAYPVVANGRLFIRDLGTLWCYQIQAARAEN
jgi:outer membrane protein assembly factor BamB